MTQINPNFKPMNPDLGQISDQAQLRQPNVGGAGPTGGGFFDQLQKSMEAVNVDQLAADSSIKDLVAGKSKNIHETMLAIQKADLSLKTMMQVRNKILEAYKEIIRMQV
jgi:flagellar hook-basal body complex protein FliE